MAEIDTSIYKNAVSQDPGEVQNKLLQNLSAQQGLVQGQQAIQANQIKLATERFGMINNAASGLLSDPDLGKKDVTGKLWDTLGRLTKGDAMSAQHAVQFMQQFPSDPQQQVQAVKNVHSQTLGAWEKGKAYLGETQGLDTGGGTKFIRAPAFGGSGQPKDVGYVPNTLQPATKQVNPDLSESYVGGTGNPPIQGPAPRAPINNPASAATGWTTGPTTNAQTGAPMPQGAGNIKPQPIVAAPSPDEAIARKGSADAYNDAMAAAGKYAQRINPLRQAIPILEKMKETEIGPTSDKWNDIKSTAISLGAGPLLGIDPEKIKNLNELKKYFNQYASQAAATLGPKTNDGLATAVTSNPNIHMDKLSATDLSKVAFGIERMQQAGAHEFNDAVQAGKAKPGDYNKFMLKWATDQDPRAFVYDLMDKKAQDAVKKLPTAERAKVAEGMRIAEKWKLLGDVHRE